MGTKSGLDYLDESKALGAPVEIAEAVARPWEPRSTTRAPTVDFASAFTPIERAAGVTVGRPER